MILFPRKLLLFGLFGCVVSKMKIVDLTHTLSEASVAYPLNPPFKLTIDFRGEADGGYWYESNSFSTGEHMGTHLDAPGHFYKDRHHVADIPVDAFIQPLVILDVVDEAFKNRDYLVSTNDVKKWESEFGRIPDKAIVIMNTGWSTKYPNKTEILGTSLVKDSTKYHFPGFHVDAATWLIENRKVSMIGTDTPSTDYGQSTTYPVHVVLGKNNIPGLENVASLGAVPQKGATLFVGALKIHDGSGTPIRAIATFDDEASSSNRAYFSLTLIIFLMCILLVQSL